MFDNGTKWDDAFLRQWSVYDSATDGDDTLTGTSASGDFGGGKGNDTLDGGAGNETYIYARGDGNDLILEGAWSGTNDRLVFTDINTSDVTLVRNGNDLTIVIAESAPGAGDAGSILIKDTLNDDMQRGIEQVVFANGTVWTRPQLRDILLTNTQADEMLSGFSGNDTFRYARGDGNDTIVEGAWSGTNDRLVFTDINSSDVMLVRNGNDLTIVIAESAPGAGDAGSILIKDTFNDDMQRGIEEIVFADSTAWTRMDLISHVAYIAGTDGNDTVTGSDGDDGTIFAGRGDDRLVGLSGSDNYVYASGDGNDSIEETSNSSSDVDVLTFTDLNVADLTFIRTGNHIKITVNSTGHIITLGNQIYSDTSYYGVEQIQFADGTIWDRAQLKAAAIPRIDGTNGDDTLVGTALNDIFYGGLGNDHFRSGAGSDTYMYASGDGNDYIDDESGSTTDVDVLKLTDLNIGDLTFSRSGTHAKITVNSTGHVITLDEQFYSDAAFYGVEQIQFADGTVWDRAQIKTAAISRINGTNGDDTLSGTPLNDVFNGGLGNDRFNSGAGSDTYIYASGDGNDYIDDESGLTTDIDVLKLTNLNVGDLTFIRSGTHAKIMVNSTGHTITLDEQFYSDTAYYGIEQIQFADGTVWDRAQIKAAAWIRGTGGNDTLTGASGNDTLFGDTGNDTITTGAGNDIIVFKPNFGMDTITDFQAGAGPADVLEFDSNLFADFEAVLAAAAQVGSDTVITYDADNAVTLKNVGLTSLHEDDVRFLA